MLCLRLFAEFFKIGLFAVGGGMAALPFLYDLSDATGWFTHAQLTNMIAVAESTPGPIGVNAATYVGFTVCGIGGALSATLGLVMPSFLVILAVAAFLNSFRGNRLVDGAFYALRPASTALITAAGLSVVQTVFLDAAVFRWESLALAMALLLLTTFVKPTRKLHPVVFIALAALVGVICRLGA